MKSDARMMFGPEDIACFILRDDLRDSERDNVINGMYRFHRDRINEKFRNNNPLFRKYVDHTLVMWKLPPDELRSADRIMSELGMESFSAMESAMNSGLMEEKMKWLRCQFRQQTKKKILFCNIAYMKYYEGAAKEDTPTGAGKWVAENNDGHEKWNFLNYGGRCYGFVQNRGRFRLERFEGVPLSAEQTDGVTVIWCAPKRNDKTVIVGWYENATVFRDYRVCVHTPTTGLDRWYFCSADSKDCYLLPESERIFEIPRASVAGRGKGFGQQNYWYAESEYAKKELIPKALEFMAAHGKNRVNRADISGAIPLEQPARLSDREKVEFEKTPDGLEDWRRALYLAYRSYEETKSADAAYRVALAYQALYQFKEAVKWLEVTEKIEGRSWRIVSIFPDWYQQVGEYEKTILYANLVLEFPKGKDRDIIDEIYCKLADNYYYLGKLDEAMKYQDKIINESHNEDLIAHVKKVKKLWIEKNGF